MSSDPSEHVHLAFPAMDDATVRAFHAAALAAGYEDHGGPGERAVYHPGYYGSDGGIVAIDILADPGRLRELDLALLD